MNKKPIIMLIAFTLCASLVFGYSLERSYGFYSGALNVLAKTGERLASAFGVNVDARQNYFVNDYKDIELGVYYHEKDGVVYNVKSLIDMLLPDYITTSKVNNRQVLLYDTFYSGEIMLNADMKQTSVSQYGSYDTYISDNRTLFTSDRIIRMSLSYSFEGLARYFYIYIVREPTSGKALYLCQEYYSTYVTPSYGLNTYDEFSSNKGKVPNSEHSLLIAEKIWLYYQYNYYIVDNYNVVRGITIENLIDNGIALNYDMSSFIDLKE